MAYFLATLYVVFWSRFRERQTNISPPPSRGVPLFLQLHHSWNDTGIGSASKMTYIVSGGALNSTHSLAGIGGKNV